MFQLNPAASEPPEGDEAPSDDNELLDGDLTLWINPGATSSHIWQLKLELSRDVNVHIAAAGGVASSGSYLRLNIQKPVPFLETLRQIPLVREVSKEGYDIHVTLY